MDEGSDSRIRTLLRSIFGKNDSPLEEHILEAKDDGEIKGEEVHMLLNVLELEDKLVADVMVPRTDMVAADVDATPRDIAELITEHGHSRIPIYEGSRDNILGIVHAKDLLASILRPADAPESLRELVRAAYFVPDTTNLKQLLRTFQTERVHMAIALDEYGGTSGMVTMEDVLEEIVGEIEDEYDAERPEEFREQEDGSLLVSGRAWLEDLEDRYGISLDSDQVDTLGGYLSQHAGRIPQEGETFTIDARQFTVRSATPKSIDLVHIQALPATVD